MTHPRRSVDPSGYPGLVVIHLGCRARNLNGIRSLLRIGRGLRRLRSDPPDGLLAHEVLWFGFLHPGNGGVWHETYRLAGGMEAIHSGVPRIGLAGFTPERDPAGSFGSARQRIGG